MEQPDVEVFVKIGDIMVNLGVAPLNSVFGLIAEPTEEAEYLFSNSEVNPVELIKLAKEKKNGTD